MIKSMKKENSDKTAFYKKSFTSLKEVADKFEESEKCNQIYTNKIINLYDEIDCL